ncbi:MAG: hypothetical protein QME55_08305 [Brevundimonas sp.]|uniref:hypothetical protein n=1 Tax=Brevundimonas sp. TaxID=1871086 RepID=UPI00263566BF|nr:hypothetical protein [Brevundimonas sp.]MDI6624718.1 hypothetical protein [Brevundimonas sp.]MDQ7812720.1 hypothetical protein [Brevundimonas sp.]
MKRLFALVAIASAFAVTACDDPRPAEPEVMDAPIEEPVAPSIEEVQAPVAAPSATDTPPDNSRSPTEKRTSEESVQPDSETLFY